MCVPEKQQLGKAESHPSMQKMLDENLQQPEALIRQLLQRNCASTAV